MVFVFFANFEFFKHGLFDFPGCNSFFVGFYLVGFLVEFNLEDFSFEVFAVDLIQGNFYFSNLFGFFDLFVFGLDDVFDCNLVGYFNYFVFGCYNVCLRLDIGVNV